MQCVKPSGNRGDFNCLPLPSVFVSFNGFKGLPEGPIAQILSIITDSFTMTAYPISILCLISRVLRHGQQLS
jgi:hypothetical protein